MGYNKAGFVILFPLSLTRPDFARFLLIFSLKSYINKNKSSRKEVPFMIVTATEFKTNFGKYLEMSTKEDIFITRNKKAFEEFEIPLLTPSELLQQIS